MKFRASHPSPVRVALCVAAFLLHGSPLVMASSHLIFFGTYTKSTSRGIYAARLDDETGALTTPTLVAETANPTWITFSPDKQCLYAVHGSKAQAVGYRIDASGPKLTPLPRNPEANTPAGSSCHLAVDATGKMLLAANYGDGYVAAMPIKSDGTLGAPNVYQHTGHGPNPQRQDKPHVHSVTISPDNRFAIVCDLGLDKIFTYALDPAAAKLTPGNPPYAEAQPTSGPRHSKFSNDGRHLYVLTEMGSTLEAYNYDASHGALQRFQIISTVPADYQAKWGAEVRVHPNGRFLYASNRGHDSITVMAIEPSTGKLSPVEVVPSGGAIPRNFALSPNGKWLVCAHQDSGEVSVFKVDAETGKLTHLPNDRNVAMGVCVLFYD